MKMILTAKGWRSVSTVTVLGSIGLSALVGLAQDAPNPFGAKPAAAPAAAPAVAPPAFGGNDVEHPCVPLPQGLLAWLPGEDKPDDIFANKISMDEGVTFAPGKVGQAFNLRGAGLKIAATPKLDVGTGAGFTIETWINPTDVQPQHPVFDFNNGTDFGVHLWIFSMDRTPGVLFGNFMDTAGNSHIITTQADSVKAGEWQHIAMTYDKKTGVAAIYINGLPAAQQTVGQFRPQTTYDLIVGYRPGGLGKGMRYTGLVDEISLYNRPLSATEIRSISQAGTSGKCNPQAAKPITVPVVDKPTPTPTPTPTATPTPTPTPTLIPAVKLRQPLGAFTFATGEGISGDIATKIVDGLTDELRKTGVDVKPRQHMDRAFNTLAAEYDKQHADAGAAPNAAGDQVLAPALRDAGLRKRAAAQMSANTILWGEVQQFVVTKGQAARVKFVVRLINAATGVAAPEIVVSESLAEDLNLTPDDALAALIAKAIPAAANRIKPVLTN